MNVCVFTASTGFSGKVLCLTTGKRSSSTNYFNGTENKSNFVFLWFGLFLLNGGFPTVYSLMLRTIFLSVLEIPLWSFRSFIFFNAVLSSPSMDCHLTLSLFHVSSVFNPHCGLPSLPPPVVKERGEQVSADSLSLIFWASVQNTYTSVGAGLLPLWNF